MEDTYLTCDYKRIAVVILSLGSGTGIWYEGKANYISVNIQCYLFATDLLEVTFIWVWK
jgi:hypothetical protein